MPGNRFFYKLISVIGRLNKYRTTVMTMAVVVVFISTYILILPAFTLEKDEAVKQGGIDIGTEASEDATDEKSDAVRVDEEAAVEPSEEKDASEVKKAVKKADASKTKDALSEPLTFEGEGFSIAVEDSTGTLPEKTSIEATELVENPTEGTKAERKGAAEEYRNYYEKALEAVNDEAKGKTEKKISFVKFYDITLQSGDEAIQPEKPVNVTISYDEQQQRELKVEEEQDVRIIHFAEDEKTGEITAEIIDDKNVDVTLKKSRMADTTFKADRFSVYGIVYTVDFEYSVNGKTYQFSLPGGERIALSDLIEVLGVIDDTNGADKAEFQSTEDFLTEVNDVEFSDESLVKVTQVEGDWELESLQAFDTDESLIIIMKNGDVITVKVTDAQISKDVLTAKGATYTITVEYDDDAEIPENADLAVREIPEDTEEYQGYLKDSSKELGVDESNVSFARFFDIEIVNNGEKIEPKAPVQVKIAYKDALSIGRSQALRVVHFAEDEMEVIEGEQIAIAEDGKGLIYQQESFSVTGTIIADESGPNLGQQYVLIVKRGNKYYSVRNDGTLEAADNMYDPATNSMKVDIEYPLLWKYQSVFVNANPYEYWNHAKQPYNFLIPTIAKHFAENNVADQYYYRYINPREDKGWSEESDTYPDLAWWSSVHYDNHHIHSDGDNAGRFIGVSEDGGLLSIRGNVGESDAAEILLATVSVPPPNNPTHDTHMVNHIDISIAGGSQISIPLAYGDYYDAGGNVVYTATKADHILEMAPSIPLTVNDMKKADISASAVVDGERVELDNVFYITGYSQNHETSAENLAQVRVEGSFKVSNIPDAVNADNNPTVCAARKANPIDYSVSIKKTVPVNVLYHGQQLYSDQNGTSPLVFNIPISLTASFNYWDEGNDCPPLHINFDENADFVQDWNDGKIIGNGWDMSGMDFELGTSAQSNIGAPAIEINKAVLKEDGSYLETNAPHNVAVNVFYKEKAAGEEDDFVNVAVEDSIEEDALSDLTNGYTQLHSKTVTIGSDGIGATYDYDVDQGLLYIQEDKNSVKQYLTGADGKRYQYVSTCMETEYAWRTNGDEGKVHNADGMTSVPEVLGEYAYEDNTDLDNSFLVFYIYNVYKEVETVDVPVDKSWPEIENDDTYTWTASFVLEEKEVHESGPVSPEANTAVYRAVEDVNPITISKGDSGDSITFKGLPKYRYYDVDGEQSVYRIMYSVDETAYELKKNGTTVSKWDKTNGLTVGDEVYIPYWPHDAGDADDEMHLGPDDENFYHVIVENHKKDITVKELLTDLRINKQWEDGALEKAGVAEKDAFATFHLKRYVTTEHLSYDSNYYDGTDATVTLISESSGIPKTLTVKKGAKVNIVAAISGTGEVRYNINSQAGGAPRYVTLSRSWDGDTELKTSADILITGNTTITKGNFNWGSGSVSSDYLQLAASGGSETAEDTEFTNENLYYTLNRADGWTQSLNNLPLYAETDVKNGEQNIYHYSYYFTEVDSNPVGYYSEFSDGSGNPIGDASHRITEDHTTVVAVNKKIPDFYVKKEWHDIEDPDNYPEIRFTLYQGLKNGDRVAEGSIFVGSNGESYVDIPLNSDNNWTWKCPGFLPTTNAAGQEVGYYVVENANGSSTRLYNNSTLDAFGYAIEYGSEISVSDTGYGTVRVWGYYNDQNNNRTYQQNVTDTLNAWNGGFAGNTGTLTIVNRSPKYKQMDIKKKIYEYQADGSLATTTSSPSREHDFVIEIQLYRRIYRLDQTGENAPYLVDWEPYGVPFMIGYGPTIGGAIQVNDNDFPIVYRGAWHWTIMDDRQENGLPAYGYYEVNGEMIPVRYRYIPFEIGAYADTERTPYHDGYDWLVGLQPDAWDGDGSQYHTFKPIEEGQDQDRLVNIQATDLEVDKEWGGTPDNVEEVYVKIWRQPHSGGAIEDLTNDLATRTDTFSEYGFVDDPSRLTTIGDGVLVLGLTPGTGGILIHNVQLTPLSNGNLATNYYEYWIEEIGYKDKDGNIYLNDSGTSSATSSFFPEYGKSDSQGNWISTWTPIPTNNKLKLSTRGNNKLRVSNHPTKDIKVNKQWIDENGNVLENPWNKAGTTDPVASSISFKVKRSDGRYLTFNGSNLLTISSGGQRAVVRTSSVDSIAYTATYVPDSNDAASIDAWTTLIHGLQKYASDGSEYSYTVEEVKDQNGKPLDSDGNIIEGCYTSVTGSGASFVIKNEKVDTSLAIEKKFAGSVELTENQKQKITFTVTGKFDGHQESSRVFVYGVDGINENGAQQQTDAYKWNDGILIINDIKPGTYIVTEQYDSVESVFEGDTSGNVYSHKRTYSVSAGTVNGDVSASAEVSEGDRTIVTVTNAYDEGPSSIDVTLIKVDEDHVNDADPPKLFGAAFTLSKYARKGDQGKDTTWGNNGSIILRDEKQGENNYSREGSFVFEGLTEGYYVIDEIEFPDGYVKLSGNPSFNVINNSATGNLEITLDDDADGLIRLVDGELTIIVGNTPGAALPHTGGSGTALIYIIGFMLIGLAGAGLVLKRRRRNAA